MNKDVIFDNFYQIIDYYLENYFLLKNKCKYSFECEYGSIEFYKTNKSNYIIVHEIYIKDIYRNKGFCKDFLKYLIDKCDSKYQIVIQSVLSKILYYFLLRFEHNGYKFFVKKQGFYCDKYTKYVNS